MHKVPNTQNQYDFVVLNEISVSENTKKAKKLLTREYYDMIAGLHKYNVGRPIKIPDYDTYIRMISKISAHIAAGEPMPYNMAPVVLIKVQGHICEHVIPLQFIKDEESKENNVIPTIPYDTNSQDIFDMFVKPVPDELLFDIGLVYVAQGLEKALVNLCDYRHLKKFQRYYKKADYVKCIVANKYQMNNYNAISTLLSDHIEVAREYWKGRGEPGLIFSGAEKIYYGHDCLPTMLVYIEQDNKSGVGLFTQYKENELYWDFSYRPDVNHMGNNILYAGAEYAKQNNIDFLNLGVNFLEWKQRWTQGNFVYQPGLRFSKVPFNDNIACMLLEEVLYICNDVTMEY